MGNQSLITELTQGKELAIQLRTHLHPSSSPAEACLFLTEMIHSSFENALLLLNWKSSASAMPDPALGVKQESSDNKRKATRSSADLPKKRKLMPRWTEEIKVSSGTAPEGPLKDGYNWRKYGQKDIHGANFPRCYYRCTHRHVRGCLATKQVQRSDNDSNIFEVTYRGRHTCNQSSNLGLMISVSNDQNEIVPVDQETNQKQQNPNSEIWFNFEEQNHFNHVKIEDFDSVFSSISFPSSIGSEIGNENAFYEPTGFINDVGGMSAVSSTTSEMAWNWSGYDGGDNAGIQTVQSSEQSDVTEIISTTTSVTNSPIYNGDWDFSHVFYQSFPFDSLDL